MELIRGDIIVNTEDPLSAAVLRKTRNSQLERVVDLALRNSLEQGTELSIRCALTHLTRIQPSTKILNNLSTALQSCAAPSWSIAHLVEGCSALAA